MATKGIPYGVTDFRLIREGRYYYVDKTRYITLVEDAARFFFLIRPRRFGKSLFINMLTWYYDINRKDRFEELFGDLYIGQHPTEEQGKYLILSFNFSAVNPDPDKLIESFEWHCHLRFMEFVGAYASYFDSGFAEEVKNAPSATAKFSYIISKAKELELPIYLVIDEYDNFSNVILANTGTAHYKSLTHGAGVFRFFFNLIKEEATGDGPIKRMFITGVSPVTMDDVTSGFNIGANMSCDIRFNNIIGFNEREVKQMLNYYKEEADISDPVDDLVKMIKPWYDNYCFSVDSLDEPIYNSDMILYFLNNYLPHKKPYFNMIDNNIRTDYNKLRHLIRLDKTFGLNASIIQDIIANGSIVAEIKTAFPAEDLAKPDNFKSLLYYYGLLSISGVKRGDTVLSIPNLTVREQLYGYLIEAYREAKLFELDLSNLNNLVKDMAYDGVWEPAFRYFASELERQSAIREFIEGEAHIKGFLLAYLGLTRAFIIYPEHESNKGYADFYMMPDLIHQPEIAYSYIVEVKYANRDASSAEIEALKSEATKQLHRYADDPKVQQTKGHTLLRLITLVFRGWTLEVCELAE